jgi:hypothetical protein
MTAVVAVAIGLAAGLHAAAYGAYKDSPHESFLPRRFARELLFAGGAGACLATWGHLSGQTPFVVFLSVFALARIATEFWKLFVRVEPQEDFRIPTQIHFFRTVVHHPVLRLLFGLAFLGGIYGLYSLFKLLPRDISPIVRGLIVGGGMGVGEALVGAYKDGTIEGFSWRKFAKSPVFGTLGGLLAAMHTTDLAFLFLASVGTMRMCNELFFKILVKDYAPGKFRSMTGPFPVWLALRRYFLVPYMATWVLYVTFLVQPALTSNAGQVIVLLR